MPLYTKGPVTNEQKDALDYEAPFGEYMGAMVEQGLRDLPTAQSQRVVHVEEADAPAPPTIDDAFILAADPAAGFDTPTLIDRARQLRREDPASQAARMSKQDALAKAKAAGVDINVPDRGLTPFAVDLLINEAKERNRRALIMERHQTGLGSVAGWGAYFGVQLLDPVNIGTAFVPVIGEARYADILRRSSQLAGGVGRTGARLGVGAAEGVVGSMLIEPMIYSNEQVLNADYGMADSLLNIAFGGVLGGGLHAVGGGIGDLYRARTGSAQPWSAPQVLEDVLAQEPVAPTATMVTGRAGDVRIGDEYVPSQWAVVDAGDVRATMDKADNQFRDRGRVSSDEQIREIANNIDFRMLGESPVMDYGSPTLSRDGRIIGGNGRMAAIDMAYDIGKGGQYREAMLEVLDQLGIDADAVRRMKKPALVRVLQKDVNVREAAILSNEGGAMRMSALEQAKVDAERMGDFLAFEVADDGNLATAGNRGFIRQWVDKYPKNQRNALVDADGMLSAEGLRRLQNGILFRAYGDSPTLTRLIEATDPGSRNIASAMTRAAAVAADARAEIAAGNMWDVDIADDLRAAVEKMDDLRRRGMSVQEFFDQMDAFGSGLTPEAEALLRYIGENIRSPRALAAVVSRYYDLLRQAGGPNQGDMFGGGAPVKGDLLDAAMRDARAATTAADVAEAATPQQRRAAMQASVAQAATGRSVEVVPIMAGGSRQDFMGAAERLDSPESIRVADFDAAAEVDQRAGQKSDVETAMDEAMTLAKDAAAGAKFSRGAWSFSPALRALAGIKQAKGTAQQWISMLTKAPGVKKEEIEWTGVVDWLNGQKGSVSRDDVAAYLERTQVKLEEVTKGGEASADLRNLPFQAVEVDGEWNVRSPNGGLEYRHGSGLTRDQAEQHAYDYSAGYLRRRGGSLPQMPDGFVVRRATAEDVDDGLVDDDTVGRWALAVGDDDTVGEVNGTLMAESYAEAVVEAVNMLRDLGDEDFLADVVIPPSMPRWSSLTLPGGKNYTELLLKLNVPESARPFIHNAHWDDQQNVLAHIRFDEFERDGKRYLRVFEMQSDWHQSGRREGYKNGKRLKEVRQRLADLREIDGGKWTPELEAEETALIGERDRLTGAGVVPDAPFKTSWPELTLKRVIALAAERGLDGVLWPDAALVPEIEKWGKTLDQIKSSPDDSKKFGAILDRYEVTLPRIAKDLTKKFGGKVGEVRVDNSQGRSLVDIAKEHSLEIWKSGDEIKFYSGVDVVDYDDLPRPVMRALDKLLENVADGDLSGVDIYAAIDWQDVATAERWHAVELDDRLRETVAGGLPLFARGDGDAAATPRDAVLATARQSFGDATDDLVAAGRIEVVDTVEDLPIPVPSDVKGVELGGRVYLVASNLRPDEVRGVVLHEVGVHSGMRGLLGDDVFGQVLADVDARVAAGDKAFVEARERAIAYSNKPEHVREETVAYLVQNAPTLSWVQELLAKIKAAIYRLTGGKLFDLDQADLQMLAVAALRKAANDERVARMDAAVPAYSRGEKPAAPGDLNAELKPFDEAIKRAELYGTAVRAAAERLGDDEAARAAMATATGDKLLAAEVDDLLAMLKKEHGRVRASLRKARDQFTAEDAADALQDDAMRAADTVANNVKLAAEIEKRNAALNIAAKMRGIQFAQQFADKREGFMALLSGSAVAKNGSRLSAQAEQKAFLGRWTGGMIADLEKAGLWKLFVSDTMSRETMQALSALTSGVEPDAGLPKQAVAMARVVHKYLEDSRNVRNRFGAWIRDLRGYTVRQSHDMFKIRKAGYEAWRDFVLPRLDVERSLREFPDADVERFLQGAYNDFAAGLHMEYLKPEDVAPFKGPGNLAKRQSQSRVIYLKDAAAEHAYLEQFGVGRFSEAVLQQLTAAANSAGMLKVLGTNPEANLEAMMDAVESQMMADPVARQKFNEQRKQVLSLLGYLDGKANIPGNAMAARISANLRAWQSMAKLGGALLSSITDLAVYSSEVKYQGRGGYLSGMSEAIGGLVQGRRGAERRQMLMSMGVFFDSMVGEVNRRFDADDLMGGTSSWLMQKFFKWNGLQWWTESLRMSSALSFSSHLAETAGKSWAKLGPDFQRVLGLYRIDEGKWDVLRMATLREADGRRYLTPDGLDAVPDAALENYLVQAGRTVTPASLTNLRDDLRQALRAMIIDRGEHAIIEPDARTRWWLLRGQPPGTVWGETARFIAQFKGFPVAVLQRTLGREVYGRGSETLSQALRNGNGEMLGLVQLLAWMTLMGYGAMTAKDLLKGKAPRPVDDHRTWMAAMLQGGAAGIYGDFLFGEMRNRFGSGLLSTVAGPVIGTASDVADLWGRVRAGDDAAARAFRLLLQNTPFMNLFYTRIAMDYLFLYNLQEQMNPGYLRRMERRAEQENGQQWLLRPSEAAL